MLRTTLLKRLSIAICILAIVNFIAGHFDWYDLVWWFDMPMHFLGGLCVFYISAIIWQGALKWVSPGRFLYECLITSVLLGILWEALELYLHIHYGSPNFILLDSLSDICFDAAGALLGALATLPLLYPVIKEGEITTISEPGLSNK